MHQLTSIAFSHYVEKARWALDRFGVPFRDRKLLPFVHFPVVWAVQRGKAGRADAVSSPYSTPVLKTPEGELLCDSAAIVRYASDRFAPAGESLYPGSEVETLEQRVHDKLGPHGRRVVYGIMFAELDLLRDTARHNVGPVQTAAFLLALPLIVGQMRKVFAITPENLALSRDVVKREMDAVSERLADGRPYLAGDRFSAADLSFACMAAPAVMPPGYSAWIPDVARLPQDAQAFVRELRETAAGKHALRMFAEERHRSVAARTT